MPKTFKKEFITNGLAAHVLKRKKRKNAISFEIRYRRNGYNICVAASTIETAKEKFIQATLPENIEKYRKKHISANKTAEKTIKSVGLEWLKSKDGKVDPRTLKDYQMNCETRIFPIIGDLPISNIRTGNITEIINNAKGRVIETLQTIFKGIMKYAMANGDITFNPTRITSTTIKSNTRMSSHSIPSGRLLDFISTKALLLPIWNPPPNGVDY